MLIIVNKQITLFYLLIIFISLLFSCNQTLNKIDINKSQTDSISFYIKEYKIKKANPDEQNKYLARAKQLNDLIQNNSLKKENNLKIAFLVYKNSNDLFFKDANKEALELSLKLKDTSGIAEANWHYGLFFGKKEILDSSYYHYFQAYKYYDIINHKNYAAKMLYNMAFIQSRLKDFTGSESKLFQAISIYKPLKKNLSLYKCYNLLGIIYKDLEDYNNSLLYHNIALEFLDKVKTNKTYKQRSLNDLALTYRLQKKHDKSIENLSRALNRDSLYFKDIKLYTKLLDNLAYARLLNRDTLGIYNDFQKPLKIRDSLNDLAGIIVNKLHLAEYSVFSLDTLKAISYAKEANNLAIKTNNNRDILSSLLLLSKIDKENSSDYLNKHVLLTEKLEKHERSLKNKFARIRFETDEYIDKAEKLSLQKYIILISSIALISILSLLYFIKLQKRKNNELRLEKEQQNANEEIYKLLLKQQAKLEEGRHKERHRISEELHDGVLGKIFGTRMELGFLDIDGNDETKIKHENLVNGLLNIEKEIRDISHELKNESLLSKSDYISILSTLVKENSKLGNFQYKINCSESTYWNEASDVIKINCYRILQEALQNIIKHANASFVKIVLGFNNGNLNFTIQDNGKGFTIKKMNKGIGLKNMQSRTEHLNGNFNIETNPNKGTIILINLPYNSI